MPKNKSKSYFECRGMTSQSDLSILGFILVNFDSKFFLQVEIFKKFKNFKMGLRNFNFLTRLESSWFNWQRLVISKSNRVPPLPARYLLISQLWLSCRGSRDYKPTIISLPIKSLYPNPMPNLCSVSLEISKILTSEKISRFRKKRHDSENFTFILLKNFVQRYWRWPQNWPLPTCWWDYWSITLPSCPFYIIVSRKEPEFCAIHGHFRKYHIRNSFYYQKKVHFWAQKDISSI